MKKTLLLNKLILSHVSNLKNSIESLHYIPQNGVCFYFTKFYIYSFNFANQNWAVCQTSAPLATKILYLEIIFLHISLSKSNTFLICSFLHVFSNIQFFSDSVVYLLKTISQNIKKTYQRSVGSIMNISKKESKIFHSPERIRKEKNN